MSQSELNLKLARIADECRLDIIEMLEKAGSGHPGTSLSVIDMLVCLYFHEMKVDKNYAQDENRDRVVLSKGHGVPALYAVLHRLGLIEQEELFTLRQVNSRLQGHPDRVRFPYAEASTGSLGQGLSIAQGLALAQKLKKTPARTFCVLGDGETQEGQIWEAAMSAPKFKLNNLVALFDGNNGQIDGHVDEVMDLNPIADKWKAFNWNVIEINGHDFGEVCDALSESRRSGEKPTFILAHTIKGKGVSYMENKISWHGVTPNKEEAEIALKEIRSRLQS